METKHKTGEMPHCINCLLWKHEDLNSGPQHPCKNSSVPGHTYASSAEGQKIGILRAHCPVGLANW